MAAVVTEQRINEPTKKDFSDFLDDRTKMIACVTNFCATTTKMIVIQFPKCEFVCVHSLAVFFSGLNFICSVITRPARLQ